MHTDNTARPAGSRPAAAKQLRGCRRRVQAALPEPTCRLLRLQAPRPSPPARSRRQCAGGHVRSTLGGAGLVHSHGSGGGEKRLVGGHGALVCDNLPVRRPHQADGLRRSERECRQQQFWPVGSATVVISRV